MSIGSYFIDAGTLISFIFKSPQMQQVGAFLVTVGTALTAGQGTVGPVRIGSEEISVTIKPAA